MMGSGGSSLLSVFALSSIKSWQSHGAVSIIIITEQARPGCSYSRWTSLVCPANSNWTGEPRAATAAQSVQLSLYIWDSLLLTVTAHCCCCSSFKVSPLGVAGGAASRESVYAIRSVNTTEGREPTDTSQHPDRLGRDRVPGYGGLGSPGEVCLC